MSRRRLYCSAGRAIGPNEVSRWQPRNVLLPHIARLCEPPVLLLLDGEPSSALRCWSAEGRLARAIGLLGVGAPAADEALLIPGCRSVHGIGMRCAIDCLFLDRTGRVRRREALRPFGLLRDAGAASVVEVAPGAIPEAAPGVRVARAVPGTREGSPEAVHLKSDGGRSRYPHCR